MRKRIAVSAAVLFFTSLQPAQPSGCFGGEPDISPRNGSMSVPSNGRVTIARRSPAGVSWLGPNRQPIAFRERQAGSGPSAARILVSDALLQPGVHTVQTTDPDLTRTFTVISSADSLPPLLSGTLKLEAFNSPEPSSECPENVFIRARFPTPQDDRTNTNDLTYLVSLRHPDSDGPVTPDFVIPAESIAQGEVFFRFGETGCGCIPRVNLESGATYRVTVRAVDAAGHESTNTLSGSVTVPAAGLTRGRVRR